MWNYVDMVILGLFFMMLVLRCFTLNETHPYQSRLLQVVNILYGISTLLLTLRFSSILEVNKTVGPLQLALFRMCIDLLIILTQFSFVIMAFSAAITKVYASREFCDPRKSSSSVCITSFQSNAARVILRNSLTYIRRRLYHTSLILQFTPDV